MAWAIAKARRSRQADWRTRAHRLHVNPGWKLYIQPLGQEMDYRGFKARDLRSLAWVVIILGLAALSVSGRPQASKAASQGSNSGSTGNRVERGKYIVESVAMCGMCHTPRTDAGEIDSGRRLDGAAVWLLPAHPVQDWPLKAPRIAGTLPASDDDMVRLLTTGIWKDGTRLRPPMPQFRMSREDAESVVAYLRSLTPRAGD
jgi:mono/diheme cytochrome c family protein